MKLTTLTYNLHFNKALKGIKGVLDTCSPDILFLQEIATDDSELNTIQGLGYRLADFSNSFMRGKRVFGVATFYKQSHLNLVNSHIFSLPSSIYQYLTYLIRNRKLPRTVLKNEFIVSGTKKKLITYNLHLTPGTTNALRMKQLSDTFEDLHLVDKKEMIIIAGDFNYPYGRKRFEEFISHYDLKEATNNVFFTREWRMLGLLLMKLKLDYVLYKNIRCVGNEKLAVYHSDHYPIVTSFEIP